VETIRKVLISALLGFSVVAVIPSNPVMPAQEAKADGFLRLCRVWWIPAGSSRWEVYVICEGEGNAENLVKKFQAAGRPAFWEYAK